VVLFGLLKKEYDKAIEDYSKAIDLKPDYADAYFDRGNAWSEKKEYDKAIEDYDKATYLKPDNAIAYYNRGNRWLNKKEYDKAIEDYSKAIELKPDYPLAYGNRGNAWTEKKEYDKAIEDFGKVIELRPDYTDACFNRGNVWSEKKEYDKAIEDYNKAIELNPDDAGAYNNRGAAWKGKKEYDRAIEDYSKAIELKPDYTLSYYNRGNVWYDKNEYEKAIADYSKALELNPDYGHAKYWRDRTKAKLGETIITDEKKPDEPLYLFAKAVENLIDDERKEILKKCNLIMDVVDKIRKYASDNTENLVAHYTKLKVADLLVSINRSRMRYYNAVYMNDPEEGKILLECLHDESIKKAFNNGQKEEENNIYLGSFLPASQHEDELVMWRTYGKDEDKNEAAGSSIVLDTNFFDDERGFLHPEMRRDTQNETEPENVNITRPQALYRVLYYDKRRNNFVSNHKREIKEDIKKLRDALKELIKLKDNKNKSSQKNIAVDKIVYHIISELRYFFKSADYAFENELRVIQFASSVSNNVKIDNIDGQRLPKRLYIESSKLVQQYIRKIILGPKVPHPDQWMYLEAMMKKRGYKMELKNSECKFQ
jgi:tetratricopeptide (TPR) repeat protein